MKLVMPFLKLLFIDPGTDDACRSVVWTAAVGPNETAGETGVAWNDAACATLPGSADGSTTGAGKDPGNTSCSALLELLRELVMLEMEPG